MDDEQLAARRAEIPVHCAACGGEFPGTTELHNGICDECQKLTHGPNYRLVAELRRQGEKFSEYRQLANARVRDLEAEVDRLRALNEQLTKQLAQATSDRGEPDRPEARGPEVERLRDLVAAMYLEFSRHGETTLTTEQKELLADTVDSFWGSEGLGPMDRWWRDG